jgi:hypothetical protein
MDGTAMDHPLLKAIVAEGMTAVFPLVTVMVNWETGVSSSVTVKGMDSGRLGLMAQVPAANVTDTGGTAAMVRASFSVTGTVVRVVVLMVADPLLMTRVTVTAEGTAPGY